MWEMILVFRPVRATICYVHGPDMKMYCSLHLHTLARIENTLGLHKTHTREKICKRGQMKLKNRKTPANIHAQAAASSLAQCNSSPRYKTILQTLDSVLWRCYRTCREFFMRFNMFWLFLMACFCVRKIKQSWWQHVFLPAMLLFKEKDDWTPSIHLLNWMGLVRSC